ncbi:hypothetical protein MSG28_006966 [Choristoneura fumiferana]|uniref:Uncharacterized protein n=1 Tax=Choristoneura fumiferana TaxID=7141 RepID=A0ACC0JM74_CHOFU|nr:hypothetical protein MSG28_006966 [Choristoneura fumiferana]
MLGIDALHKLYSMDLPPVVLVQNCARILCCSSDVTVAARGPSDRGVVAHIAYTLHATPSATSANEYPVDIIYIWKTIPIAFRVGLHPFRWPLAAILAATGARSLLATMGS